VRNEDCTATMRMNHAEYESVRAHSNVLRRRHRPRDSRGREVHRPARKLDDRPEGFRERLRRRDGRAPGRC